MANLRLLKSELPNISGRVFELGHQVPEVASIAQKFQRASSMLAQALETIESQHKTLELSKQTIESLNTELLNCLEEIRTTKVSNATADQNVQEIYTQLYELTRSLYGQLSTDYTKDSSEHLDMIAQVTLAASEIEHQTKELQGKILAMSHSQNTLESLQRRLGAMGHKLTCCNSFEQLQQCIVSNTFDVLIYDAEGTYDYGKSVLDFVIDSADHSYIPIIVMGPLKDTLLINQSLESGADDFLPKPPNPALLKARIHSALLQKEAHDKRQQRLDELRTNQANLEHSIADLKEGIAIFDRNGRLVMHNKSYANMYPHLDSVFNNRLKGVSFKQIIKANLDASIYNNTTQTRQHILDDLLKKFAMPTANWHETLINHHTYEAVSYRTPDGGVVLTVSDISKNLKDQERLEFMAFHDSLTGLANRVLFNKRLKEMIKRKDDSGLLSAIINIDLDGFKAVNDTYGHEAGDWVLVQVGNRLTRLLREQDIVARFGGDEFCILLEGMTDKHQIAAITERILATIAQPYIREDGTELKIGGSIGIAVYPGDGHSAEGLLTASDTAMYAAKTAGKGQFHFA